jgi:hypothetical protein
MQQNPSSSEVIKAHLNEALILASDPKQKRHIREALQLVECQEMMEE